MEKAWFRWARTWESFRLVELLEGLAVLSVIEV